MSFLAIIGFGIAILLINSPSCFGFYRGFAKSKGKAFTDKGTSAAASLGMRGRTHLRSRCYSIARELAVTSNSICSFCSGCCQYDVLHFAEALLKTCQQSVLACCGNIILCYVCQWGCTWPDLLPNPTSSRASRTAVHGEGRLRFGCHANNRCRAGAAAIANPDGAEYRLGRGLRGFRRGGRLRHRGSVSSHDPRRASPQLSADNPVVSWLSPYRSQKRWPNPGLRCTHDKLPIKSMR